MPMFNKSFVSAVKHLCNLVLIFIKVTLTQSSETPILTHWIASSSQAYRNSWRIVKNDEFRELWRDFVSKNG